MKKALLNYLMILIAGSFFIVSSCNKGENEGPVYEKFSFDAEEILNSIPEGLKNSEDTYAQQCYSDIQSALDMSSFMNDMTPPEDALLSSKKSSGETWKWTISNGINVVTYYWTYEEDSQKNYWTMEIQVDAGEIYPYITAWETKDGKQGEVLYNFNWVAAFDETPQDYYDLYWRYSWVVDNSGNYTFHWDYDTNDPSYDYFLNYEVVVNADGSGRIDYYSLDSHFYHMEWDVQGNGSWIYYFGGSNLSGTWTV